MIKELKDKPDLSNSLILMGAKVCTLSEAEMRSYADEVSRKLLQHPSTMLQFSPKEIYKSMVGDRAVVAVDEKTRELLGFGHIWEERGFLEFGSWIANAKGIGKPILLAGAFVGHGLNPHVPTVAIVEELNITPQVCIEKMGGKLKGMKTSGRVFNNDSLQPAIMKIYDVSLRNLIVTGGNK